MSNLSTFQCPACGSTLRRPPQAATATGAPVHVRCPRCQAQFPIPPLEPEPAPPPPPPPPPRRQERVVESPAPPARPRFPEEEEVAVTDAPRSRERVRPASDYDNGEYEDEDYPRRRTRFVYRAELSNEYVIDIGACFRYAQIHWTSVMGPVIGFLVLIGIINVPLVVGTAFAGRAVLWISTASQLGNYFLILPLLAGISLVCLKQLKGEYWTFGDFFGGFRYYSAFLLPNFIVYLAPNLIFSALGFIPLLASFSARNTMALLLISMVLRLLLLPLWIFLYVRIGVFSWYLILDRKANGVEAIKGSWVLSQGQFWMLFVIALLAVLINIAGVFAACIGALFAKSLTELLYATNYLLAAGTKPPREEPDYRDARDDRDAELADELD